MRQSFNDFEIIAAWKLCNEGLWRYLRLGDDKVTVLDAGRTDETDLEVSAMP